MEMKFFTGCVVKRSFWNDFFSHSVRQQLHDEARCSSERSETSSLHKNSNINKHWVTDVPAASPAASLRSVSSLHWIERRSDREEKPPRWLNSEQRSHLVRSTGSTGSTGSSRWWTGRRLQKQEGAEGSSDGYLVDVWLFSSVWLWNSMLVTLCGCLYTILL